MQNSGDHRVSREEGDIGVFHHLVTAGRNRRAVAALDDVGKPVAVMLDESRIPVGKRAFRSNKPDRGDNLHQSHKETRSETFEREPIAIHKRSETKRAETIPKRGELQGLVG